MPESGEAANKFLLGDTKDIVFTYNGTSTIAIKVQIVAFNHDNLSDGSGKAGITFMCTKGFPTMVKAATSSSSRECWTTLPLLRNETKKIFSTWENEEVSSRIKTVNKITTRYTSSTEKENVTSQETVWIPSAYEIYFKVSATQDERYALFANGESIFIGQDYWLRNGCSSYSKIYMVDKNGSGLLEKSVMSTADIRWGFCL